MRRLSIIAGAILSIGLLCAWGQFGGWMQEYWVGVPNSVSLITNNTGLYWNLSNATSVSKTSASIGALWTNPTTNIADMIFNTTSGTDTTKMTIKGNGKVGIGTTTPTNILSIVGIDSTDWSGAQLNITGNSSKQLILGTAQGNRAIIQSVGFIPVCINEVTNNVGIGTSSPKQKLQVVGNTIVNGSVTAQSFVTTNTADSYFNNNITIGTSVNPAARLAVRGIGNTTNYLIRGQMKNGTDVFTILDNGKVGIGTTAPTQKLEIGGNSGVIRLLNATGVGYNCSINATNVFACTP